MQGRVIIFKMNRSWGIIKGDLILHTLSLAYFLLIGLFSERAYNIHWLFDVHSNMCISIYERVTSSKNIIVSPFTSGRGAEIAYLDSTALFHDQGNKSGNFKKP